MTPVYMEIVEYVMQKIHSGEWPVGHMIPTEMQLCDQFGVSRSTVRTAVLKMVQEGHLKRVIGKGTFVTAPRILKQSTIFIESFFEELSQQGIAVSTDVLEFRKIPVNDEISAYFDGKETEVIKLSRLRYVKDSFDKGPIVLATSYVSGNKNFMFKHDFEQVSLRSVLKEHGYARSTIQKKITAVVPTLRESLLMGVKEGALAIKITTVTRDENGVVVDVGESVYPIERNEFILEFQL